MYYYIILDWEKRMACPGLSCIQGQDSGVTGSPPEDLISKCSAENTGGLPQKKIVSGQNSPERSEEIPEYNAGNVDHSPPKLDRDFLLANHRGPQNPRPERFFTFPRRSCSLPDGKNIQPMQGQVCATLPAKTSGADKKWIEKLIRLQNDATEENFQVNYDLYLMYMEGRLNIHPPDKNKALLYFSDAIAIAILQKKELDEKKAKTASSFLAKIVKQQNTLPIEMQEALNKQLAYEGDFAASMWMIENLRDEKYFKMILHDLIQQKNSKNQILAEQAVEKLLRLEQNPSLTTEMHVLLRETEANDGSQSATSWLIDYYIHCYADPTKIPEETQKRNALGYCKSLLESHISYLQFGKDATFENPLKKPGETGETLAAKHLLFRLYINDDPVLRTDRTFDPLILLTWLKELAGYDDDAEAQYDMGIRYLRGIRCKVNLSNAKSWLMQAALQKYPDAQQQLDNVQKELDELMRAIPRIPSSQVELKERIGDGASATVRKGTLSLIKENGEVETILVAVKEVKGTGSQDPQQKEAETDTARQEILNTAAISHPNLVTPYGIIEDKKDEEENPNENEKLKRPKTQESGKVTYIVKIVMDLAKCDLADYLQQNPTLPWSWRANTLLDIANGLNYLHQMEKLHLDLKARNVLIFEEVEEGKITIKVKITDFGTVRHTSDPNANCTCYGEAVGTVTHIAPEIFDRTTNFKGTPGEFRVGPTPYTKASDAYAYAMTAYEVATNASQLYQGCNNSYQVIIKVIGVKEPPVQEPMRPHVPDTTPHWISLLIKHGLHHDPERRLTIPQMIQGLENFKEKPGYTKSFNTNFDCSGFDSALRQ